MLIGDIITHKKNHYIKTRTNPPLFYKILSTDNGFNFGRNDFVSFIGGNRWFGLGFTVKTEEFAKNKLD